MSQAREGFLTKQSSSAKTREKPERASPQRLVVMEDATVSSSKAPRPGLLVMAHSGPACGRGGECGGSVLATCVAAAAAAAWLEGAG